MVQHCSHLAKRNLKPNRSDVSNTCFGRFTATPHWAFIRLKCQCFSARLYSLANVLLGPRFITFAKGERYRNDVGHHGL